MKLYDITVTKINSVFTVYSEKGRHLNIVNRKNYGLSFCKSGKIEYTKDGVMTVSDCTCAVILPQGQCYELSGTETGEFPLINFDTDLPFTENFLRIPLRNPEAYMHDFSHMHSLWQNPYGKAKAMSIFYDILDRLSHEETTGSSLISHILKYISDNFTDPTLSNEKIAACVNISEVYMRKLFSDQMGITPKQYILELRMRLAKQLLSERSLSVTGIAEKCGFSSVYHFCRAFKVSTGQTPTEYAAFAERLGG